MNDNMGIWDRNKAINSEYMAKAKLGGREITSYSLQSVLMMATNEFGPIGSGWGYDIIEERFDKGVIILEACTTDTGDKLPQIDELIHTLVIQLWYKVDGEKCYIPHQVGHTPYIYKSKYGAISDGEYYKKSIADAIKKSLSMLGFGAEIYLGLMDDEIYKAMKEEERMLKEQSELPRKIEEFKEKVMSFCNSYKANTLSHSLSAMNQGHKNTIFTECRKLGINPDPYVNKVNVAAEERMNELKGSKK